MPRNAEVIRQWAILREIERARGGVTIDDLAAQCGVTTRTIRRDLQALEEAGFPLYDDHSHDDGRTRWTLNGQAFPRSRGRADSVGTVRSVFQPDRCSRRCRATRSATTSSTRSTSSPRRCRRTCGSFSIVCHRSSRQSAARSPRDSIPGNHRLPAASSTHPASATGHHRLPFPVERPDQDVSGSSLQAGARAGWAVPARLRPRVSRDSDVCDRPCADGHAAGRTIHPGERTARRRLSPFTRRAHRSARTCRGGVSAVSRRLRRPRMNGTNRNGSNRPRPVARA